MRSPHFDRQTLLRFAAALLGVLAALAVLVAIPLLTHRAPVPEPRYAEQTPRPTETPAPTQDPEELLRPDPLEPVADDELQTLLDTFLDEHPGSWDICVHNLSSGKFASASTQEGEPMISASLIKLFIMGAAYEEFQKGSISYWDYVGPVRKMIVISDNYSANNVIMRLGGGDNEAGFALVNDFAESLGCTGTSLNRTMLDTNSGLENYTTAEDCAKLLERIYRLQLISPQYSSEMLETLKAQLINDRIPAGLPQGTICAHKTGDLTGVCCADAGLVFSPSADYILCVINNGSEDTAAVVESIVALSSQVYAFFNPTEPETEEVLEEP